MNTTSSLSTFKFAPGLELRVIDRDGSPWFAAKDVCTALELKGYASWHTKDLDRDEVAVLSRVSNLTVAGLFDSKAPSATLVSESGLYALILRSKKPEAKEFKRWVTQQVLPTIRKTGGYMTPTVAALAVEDPAVFMARALVIANEVISGHNAKSPRRGSMGISRRSVRLGRIQCVIKCPLLGLVAAWKAGADTGDNDVVTEDPKMLIHWAVPLVVNLVNAVFSVSLREEFKGADTEEHFEPLCC